jgi:NAD(P)-dependent dehydrogenase (short-subunit alcohol dehydrogenase family)
MQDVFDFSGRTVFVAGGSSGINLGIALTFAAQGARVGILSRSQARVDAAVSITPRPQAGAPMCATPARWRLRWRPHMRASG